VDILVRIDLVLEGGERGELQEELDIYAETV